VFTAAATQASRGSEVLSLALRARGISWEMGGHRGWVDEFGVKLSAPFTMYFSWVLPFHGSAFRICQALIVDIWFLIDEPAIRLALCDT
jgi:hypothetical protein